MKIWEIGWTDILKFLEKVLRVSILYSVPGCKLFLPFFKIYFCSLIIYVIFVQNLELKIFIDMLKVRVKTTNIKNPKKILEFAVTTFYMASVYVIASKILK